MAEPRASTLSRWAKILSALERIILFEISLAVGLLNLGIALAVAARLGIVPRKPVEAVLAKAEKKTEFIWRFFEPAPGPGAKP